MEEETKELLQKVAVALIILAVLIALSMLIFRSAKETNLLGGDSERIDIIVSDRVPVGCFIPPERGESAYDAISKSDNKELIDQCFKYRDAGLADLVSQDNLVSWSDLSTSIRNGIKLDGYCSDVSRGTCLSLTEQIPTFEENEEKKYGEIIQKSEKKDESKMIPEKRSIDFGPESEMKLGSGLKSQGYTVISNPPSVFVVPEGQNAKLSVYAGIRVKGNRSVEKVTATLRLGNENSCYSEKNFGCFKDKKSTSECRCSDSRRSPDESPLEICKNFAEIQYSSSGQETAKEDYQEGCREADSRFQYYSCLLGGRENCESFCPECVPAFKDIDYTKDKCSGLSGAKLEGCEKFYESEESAPASIGNEKSCFAGKNFKLLQSGKSPEDIGCSESVRYADESPLEMCSNYADSQKKSQGFKDGCLEAYSRSRYLNCAFSGKAKCEELCEGCPDTFSSPEYTLSLCRELDGEKLEGCQQFDDFSKNVFRIESLNYTIVKVGDIEAENGYRGTAYVSAGVILSEEMPGVSCYGSKLFSGYEECCFEACRSDTNSDGKDCSVEGCSNPVDESSATTTSEDGASSKAEQSCSQKVNCSLTKGLEDDDRYLLCKNFCESHDAYYADPSNAELCTEGCDWARRLESEYGTIEAKNLEIAFVMDTSPSMDDEWDKVCAAIDTLADELDAKGYTMESVTTYSLGQSRSCPRTSIIWKTASVTIPLSTEDWAKGAGWVMDNPRWIKPETRKIIFVIGDEGPSMGGGHDDPEGDDEESANSATDNSAVAETVGKALNAENGITIYGLWGDMTEEIYTEEGKEAIKKQFTSISEQTGGFAMYFDDKTSIGNILLRQIGRGEAFEKGYGKYEGLSKEENRLSPDAPYYFRKAYQNVYSNLFYIVDWNCQGSTEWSYPYNSGGSIDWEKIRIKAVSSSGVSKSTYKGISANVSDEIKSACK